MCGGVCVSVRGREMLKTGLGGVCVRVWQTCMSGYTFIFLSECMCVSVCVCVREKERCSDRKREEADRQPHRHAPG